MGKREQTKRQGRANAPLHRRSLHEGEPYGLRGRSVASTLLVAILSFGACNVAGTAAPTAPTATVDGVVTRVEGTSPTDVGSFTLRTEDGRLLDFSVGRLALDGEAFPAGHLREHQATGQPVRVTYVAGGSTAVAIRLEDAPP